MTIICGLQTGLPLAEAARVMAQAFKAAGIDEAEADARVLIGHALRLDRTQLVVQSGRLLQKGEVAAIEALAARRLKREPVARIVGVREFWSLPFTVTADVLVPRPETETVVEAALETLGTDRRESSLRILDIGTGSGALLLALLHELPSATGIGTDISTAALAVARDNAARNGLTARSTFVACDIAAGLQGPFDLVVSNPPYMARGEIATLDPEVREYDPALALDGGRDGLDGYRTIAGVARSLLNADGRLIVELGAGQEPSVHALFTNSGLRVTAIRKDLSGMVRAMVAAVS